MYTRGKNESKIYYQVKKIDIRPSSSSPSGEDCPILSKETTTHSLNQCGTLANAN